MSSLTFFALFFFSTNSTLKVEAEAFNKKKKTDKLVADFEKKAF